MTDLKPCPFCGEKVYFSNNESMLDEPKIECYKCDLLIEFNSVHFYGSDTLKKTWNNRQ